MYLQYMKMIQIKNQIKKNIIINNSKTTMQKDIIQCEGIKFQRLYSHDQVNQQITRMASEIDSYYKQILEKDPNAKIVVLGVLNGAFMFLSQLVKRMEIPIIVQFIKCRSYSGEKIGELSFLSKPNEEIINDSYLLIVDDICDTGTTLDEVAKKMETQFKVKEIKIATMVLRPDKNPPRKPDFYGLTCSTFIVGFGLDYNEKVRHYKHIYQKVEE